MSNGPEIVLGRIASDLRAALAQRLTLEELRQAVGGVLLSIECTIDVVARRESEATDEAN